MHLSWTLSNIGLLDEAFVSSTICSDISILVFRCISFAAFIVRFFSYLFCANDHSLVIVQPFNAETELILVVTSENSSLQGL